MKKAIIFGGAGFLGSNVAEVLTKEGYEVTIFDINESPYIMDGQKFIKGDILDACQVQEAVKGNDIVYNFAGEADIDMAANNPLRTITTNIVGNTNILEACHKSVVRRFVFASTLYVYSDMGSFYRSSKQACESIIEDYHKIYGLDYTVLRYGTLYGPRSDDRNWLYAILKQALKENKITRSGDGEEIREYIHVYDAARLSAKILDEKYKNQAVMITGNQQIKIKDLMFMIKEMLNNDVKLEFLEADQEEHYEITPYKFSPKLAKKIFDDNYIDLGQGILEMMNEIHKKTVSE